MNKTITSNKAKTATILYVHSGGARTRAEMLAGAGYTVLSASTIDDLLFHTFNTRPDLVVLDSSLSKSDAAEFCHYLRSQTRGAQTPVLQLCTEQNTRLPLKPNEDADRHLVEPVEAPEFLSVIRILLRLGLHQSENERLIQQVDRLESQLTEAMETAECGLWDWDIPTGQLKWFGAHERLAGIRPGEFGGTIQNFTNALHPDDRARVWKKLQDTMAQRVERYIDEYRFVHPEGSVYWMLGTGRFFYDAEGRAIRMTGVVQDVTDHKLAHEALRESEEGQRLKSERAQLLASAAEQLLTGNDATKVMADVFDTVRCHLELDGFLHYKVDESGSRLILETWAGVTDIDVLQLREMEFSQLIYGNTARLAQSVVYEQLHKSCEQNAQPIRALGFRAYACFPLLVGERLLGTLSFVSKSRESFSSDEIEFMQTICRYAAVARDRLRMEVEAEQRAQRLHESEETLLRAQRAARAGVWDIDLITHRVTWSDSYYDLCGLSRITQPSIEAWLESIYADDRARVQTEFRSSIAAKGTHIIEFRIQRKDTGIRWLRSQGEVLCDEKGNPVRIAGITYDVTERKQAEDQSALYRTIIAASTEGIAIIDRNAHYVEQNMAHRSLTGYDDTDIKGKTPAIHLGEETFAYIGTALSEHGQWHGEVVSHPKQGGEKIIDLSAFAVHEPDGKVACYVGIKRDITARKQAETALAARSRQLEVLYELASAVNRADDLSELYEKALEAILASLHVDRASILLFDETGVMRFEAWRGLSDGYRLAVAGHSPWKPEQRDAMPIFIDNVAESEIEPSLKTVILEEGIRALGFIPLAYGGRLIGKFMVYFDQPYHPDEQEIGVAQAIAKTLATGVERKRAEEVLRTAHDAFRHLVENSPFGVYAVDADFRLVQVSAGAQKVFENVRPLLGRDFAEVLRIIWPEPFASEAIARFRHTLETGQPYRAPSTVERRQDISEVQSYDWKIERVILPDGRFGVVCHFYDLSERQRYEAALRESEERFRGIFDASPLGMCLVGPVGLLRAVNQAFCELTGYSSQELLGKSYTLFTHPDDLAANMTLTESYFSGLAQEGYSLEKRYIRKNGELRWVNMTARPFRESVRGEQLLLAVVNDFTERKLKDEALQAHEQQLKLITDTVPVFIAQCDRDGRYRFVNKRYAERLGLRPEQCVGKKISEVVGEEAYATFSHHVEAALTGETVQFEVEVPYEGIGNRHMLCSYVPERNNDGSVVGLVAVISDITPRVEAEEELRRWKDELEIRVEERTQELLQSQARLRDLATELNLAEQRERKRLATELHDHLQQLLVLGKFKLANGMRLAERDPAFAEVIKQTDDMLSDALQYTRTLVAELSPPVLREHGLIAGLKWLGEYMKRHGMTVTVIASDCCPLGLPDEQSVLLFQSVRELLINASKHAKTNEAWVMLELHADGLKIEVRDKGTGFDVAAIDKSDRLSSKFGLFSIRERMRALGGTIDLQSTPGIGTTAILMLPLSGSLKVEQDSKEGSLKTYHQPIAWSPRNAKESSTIRVLLVDDHVMVRQGLRSMLEGYADVELVGEAGDGEEAIALVEKLRPTIVIMDINMPKMNGVSATVQIKTRYPQVNVIGLSVNNSMENQEAMLNAGAAILITKEAAVENLYSAIQQAAKVNKFQA